MIHIDCCYALKQFRGIDRLRRSTNSRYDRNCRVDSVGVLFADDADNGVREFGDFIVLDGVFGELKSIDEICGRNLSG